MKCIFINFIHFSHHLSYNLKRCLKWMFYYNSSKTNPKSGFTPALFLLLTHLLICHTPPGVLVPCGGIILLALCHNVRAKGTASFTALHQGATAAQCGQPPLQPFLGEVLASCPLVLGSLAPTWNLLTNG